MKTLGEIIRSERLERNLTMIDLAEAVGTSQSAISVIENDKRFPSEETLLKIGNALNMDKNDLTELIELRNRIAYNGRSTYNGLGYNAKNFGSELASNEVKTNNGMKKTVVKNDVFSISLYSNLITKVYLSTDIDEEKISNPIYNILEESIKKAISDLLENNKEQLQNDVNKMITNYIQELSGLIKDNE